MRGWINGEKIWRGVTAFSSDEVKGTNYSDYSGSLVELYLNNYSEYISDVQGIENSVTLISKEELEAIVGTTLGTGSYLNNLGAPAFLYSTSYWTRSATDATYVWQVASGGHFDVRSYVSDGINGVRPVITIANDLFGEKVSTQITYEDTDNSESKNIGNIITISKEGASSEEFYIISDDGESLQLMSRYNLYVGGEYDGSTTTAYENATGIQDSTMRGRESDDAVRRGVVAFSDVSDEYVGSIIEGYVNSYSIYLTNTLGVENTASLITKEEIDEIVGQTLTSNSYLSTLGAPSFLYSTSYWTRSVFSTGSIWCIRYDGNFNGIDISHADNFGVRPVITISSALVE